MDLIRQGLDANDAMNHAIEHVKTAGREMAQALEELRQANVSVTGIISQLNELATVTKILALNAGVEASHAGHFGRTFAIVANEIKRVADQCKQTALDTQRILDNAQKRNDEALAHGRQIDTSITQVIMHQQKVAECFTQLASHGSGSSDFAAPAIVSTDTVPLRYDPVTMETGEPEVDRQHQELIEMVNSLETAVKEGRGKEEVAKTLDFLGDYVQKHFSMEEGIMAKRRCPAAQENIDAHRKLVEAYVQWRQKYEAQGAALSMVMELRDILAKWLKGHICKVDRCLKLQLLENAR